LDPVYPPLGRPLFISIALFTLAGSAAEIFWLVVYGVDEAKFCEVEDAKLKRMKAASLTT
jgi:hypothetical protein